MLTPWTSTEAGQITLGDYRASDHQVGGDDDRPYEHNETLSFPFDSVLDVTSPGVSR